MDTPIVLLVDDEPNILKTLRRLFMEDDYDIHTAGNGREGLAVLEDGLKPAIIISDQRMPEMGGAEFLAKAKVLVPESIRMVLTGYADINAAVTAINEGGIYRYILKPWNDDDLRQTVREAVRYYHLLAENKALSEELGEKNLRLSQANERLEEMVRLRTAELRQKVRELEGRDTIQQLLLRVHPLDELLSTLLAVVVDVCAVERASYYTLAEDSIERLATWAGEDGVDLSANDAEAQIRSRLAGLMDTGQGGVGQGQTFRHGGIECGLAPVSTGSKFFGVLAVFRRDDKPLAEAEMATVLGFALQAAIGINDCQVQDQFGDIQASLDDVLRGISEI